MAESKTKLRRNQIGELDDGVMTIERWRGRWDKGQTRFHVPNEHPSLKKYYEQLTQKNDSNCKSSFFLPLCGKSVDLYWLAEKGHTVSGNEGVELACQQFFEENNVSFTTEALQSVSGKVFKSTSTDPKINVTLYCCNFFDLTSKIAGTFDFLWDRGSLAAMNVDDRPRYSEHIVQFLHPTTRYMLCVYRLDNTNFSGPPHNISEEEIHQMYKERCSIEKLDEIDRFSQWQVEWGLDWFLETLYILTLKA